MLGLSSRRGSCARRARWSLAAALFAASCQLDSSVPDVSGSDCSDCASPNRCEGQVCVRAESSTPGDAAADGALPIDASRTGEDAAMDATQARCEPGAIEPCYDGPSDAVEHVPCALGQRTCSGAGTWGRCLDQVLPASELCNQLDDDCDGASDEAFDLESDPAHCGACNQACGAGRACCGGACVDLRNELDHCGACGTRCNLAQECCRGLCVDAQNDPENCGPSCVKCAEDQACCAGACADLRSFQHCGACGNACDPEAELCCDGECMSSADTCGT